MLNEKSGIINQEITVPNNNAIDILTKRSTYQIIIISIFKDVAYFTKEYIIIKIS